MSSTRRQWIDNFGNDIESTKTYQGRDELSSHRINLNIIPITDENIIPFARRLQRTSHINSDVQECHFNGTQKVHFCHKNPATCWECDLNTVQLFATRMVMSIIEIPQMLEIAKNIYWTQQPDGKHLWQYINPP